MSPLRARARPWSARCYGVARQRDRSRQNSRGPRACFLSGISGSRVGAEESGAASIDLLVSAARCGATGSGRHAADRAGEPRHRAPPLTPSVTLYAREGQAVVCPLLRGHSPTRWVAPKQLKGLGRAFSPAFRAGSLYPLARGRRRIWRGVSVVYWFRRRDAARADRAAWAVQWLQAARWRARRSLDLLISVPRVNLFCPPYARARARPWSARCYGVARQRDGSRQNSTGVSGVLSLCPLARRCRRIWRGVV